MKHSQPEWQCSICKNPYTWAFNSVKRANRYTNTEWCYVCMKDTEVERIPSLVIKGDTASFLGHTGKFQIESIHHSTTKDIFGTRDYGGRSTMYFTVELEILLSEEDTMELMNITKITRDGRKIDGGCSLFKISPVSEIRDDCLHPEYDAPIVGYKYYFSMIYNAR